jgi:predicted RNA methylase
LGGKWVGGKTQAHVFDPSINPELLLQAFIDRSELPDLNPLAFFATNPKTAKLLINRIHPKNTKRVLDADAGVGALSIALKAKHPNVVIDLVEIDKGRADELRKLELGKVFEQDFLSFCNSGYTCIVMNPPFAIKEDTKAYITHIQHAWDLLESDGQLIAIAPMGFTFSSDKRSSEFKKFVETFGYYEELPPKSFDGTDVMAVVVVLDKPKVYVQPVKQQQLTLF